MKVCLVGQFNDSLDEGKRNVGKSLKVGLELQDIEVEKVDIFSLIEWRAIKAFRPDIIHFILTPTFLGVSIARLASSAFPPAKTVISAVHPSLRQSHLFRLFSVLLPTPDLIFLIDVPPEVCYIRKKREIGSVQEARDKWETYQILPPVLGQLTDRRIVQVDNTRNPLDVNEDILGTALELLEGDGH